MTSIERWQTSWRWAVAVGGLVCSLTDVSAQEGRWERVTAVGVQAFAQSDYAVAARQFQAALPLADAGSLVPSLMNLAAVYDAQEQYTDAARLYQRALVLQEQVVGPDDPQLIPVLEANAAVHRKMHPVRSLGPWSTANQMAARVRRIQERALLADLPWGPPSARQLLGDGTGGE